MPLSSICQARDSTRIDSAAANARPRVRSASPSEIVVGDRRHDLDAGDEMGELGEVGQHHRRIGAGVVLLAQLARAPRRRRRVISASNRSMMRVRSARPSMLRTSSRAHRARRHARSPGRAATARRAPSLRRRARSAPAPRARRRCFSLRGDAGEMRRPASSASTRRRSKRWQRDSTVTGTLRISVVAKMNLTCGGGSSSVFSSALKAALRQHVHFVDDVDLVARRRPARSGSRR